MKEPKPTATIQFFKGINEGSIPEIRLTRSKDGKTGRAFFIFEKPEALNYENFKEIKGMFLLDEEGQITTRDVNLTVSNGKYSSIKAIYNWKSDQDFNRFMRFAKRYAEDHGLGYTEN